MIVTVTTWAILFDPDVGSWKIIGIILGVSFIYLLINSLVFVLPNLLIIFFVPLILFLVLLSIGKIDIISSTAVKALHMGNFKANVIFKSNYCEALKNYNILTDKRSDTSCSVRVNNVHWRVGKESLLEIKDKNITVPSDQIISMQWPVDKNTTNQENNVSKLKIISFDFNSTVLTKSGKANLITQAKALDANKTKEITVYGCASPDGTEKYNKTLSLKRAETVKTWLDGYLARDAKDIKINVVGEGTSKHCTDEKLEKELQEHRKVIIE
jgi:outer membrane protein OmpA-like peptidoglycan-associated protein